MEECRFTANKWRIDLLERQSKNLDERLNVLSDRIFSLKKTQLCLSIALTIVSIGLFVHIILLHT